MEVDGRDGRTSQLGNGVVRPSLLFQVMMSIDRNIDQAAYNLISKTNGMMVLATNPS
jgi:hypothetical protein